MKKDVLTVIDSLYATVEAPTVWGAALAGVSEWLDASIGMIATPTSTQRQSPFYVDYNHSPEAGELYASHYHSQDLILHKGIELGLFRAGAVSFSDALISRKELQRSAYYNEFMRPKMNAESYMGAVISDEKTDHCLPSLFTSFFRRPGADYFNQDDALRLRQILPHLQRAVILRKTMQGLAEQQAHLAAAFDSFSQAILLLKPDGHLLHANQAGQQCLNHWQRVRHSRPWPKEISRIVHLASLGQVAAERLPHEEGACLAIAYPVGERTAQVMDCRPSTLMLLIVNTRKPPTEVYQAVARAYDLTDAELRLLPLMAQALAPTEMAQMLGVHISTIRTQLSAIYGKTGLRRQQDVMAMLGCLPTLQ